MTELEKKIQNLRARAPKWKPEYAKEADETSVGGGWVKTQTDYAPLLEEPNSNILAKALELTGRGDDFLTEHDPFAGLAAKVPERALAALRDVAARGEYPEWAWRKFLNPKARENDKPDFAGGLAEQLIEMPAQSLNAIIYYASNWVSECAETLAKCGLKLWDRLVQKLIYTLREYPNAVGSTIVRTDRELDWASEAINSSAGMIAMALMKDPRISDLDPEEELPPKWLTCLDELLSLEEDHGRHALVICAHNLNWFFLRDPVWTGKALLSALDGDESDDRDAFWDGFFWGAKIPVPKLYIRIKPDLLVAAKKESFSRRGHAGVLASIILAGWGMVNKETGNRFLFNDEMREVLLHSNEEFRSSVIWTLGRWMEETGAEKSEGLSDSEKKEQLNWGDLAPELLRDAWPRQIFVKSPRISSQLFDLAFSDSERFSEIADSVLPLLTPVGEDHLMMHHLRKDEGKKSKIVEEHPEKTLALVYAVLGDNVARWPHGIGEILQKIEEADGALRSDARLLELKRKWDGR